MKFHCIYWPAFLMALDLALPEHLAITGWWTKDKKKISKSEGNSFEIDETLHQIGGTYATDVFRYILMRERFDRSLSC